jgi:peptide/nickel transport system substrate-binding protein
MIIRLSLSGIAGVLLFFSAACSRSQHSPSDAITLAWDNSPRSVDPRYVVDANSHYLENLLHCSLMSFDMDGSVTGQLAESWRWKTPIELEIHLRADARFSDGSQVTAQDVKATYDFFLREEKDPSPRQGAFELVSEITVESSDDETEAKSKVTFHLKEPDAAFLTNLVVGILPSKLAGGLRIRDATNLAGCGPYQLSKWSVGRIELRKNRHFSLLEGYPKMPRVIIKIVQDEGTRYAKLRKGEVDIVQNLISRDQLPSIQTDLPDFQIIRRAGLNVTYLGFNMRDEITGNAQVRQAISHAIERESIIESVLHGYAVPARSMLPPQDPYFDHTVKSPKLDLETAKRLLDQAGFPHPDGDETKPRFRLSYKTTTNQTRITIARAIANQLRQIGIEVQVEALEWGRFKDDVDHGRVQMWSLAWIGFKDPDIFRYTFSTESFPPGGGNRGWYSNEKLDALLVQGRGTVDPVERKKIYSQVQNQVAQDIPYIFLWHEEVFAVVRPELKGFELYADGRLESFLRVQKEIQENAPNEQP